jgi:hypothetical protein
MIHGIKNFALVSLIAIICGACSQSNSSSGSSQNSAVKKICTEVFNVDDGELMNRIKQSILDETYPTGPVFNTVGVLIIEEAMAAPNDVDLQTLRKDFGAFLSKTSDIKRFKEDGFNLDKLPNMFDDAQTEFDKIENFCNSLS